MNMPGFTAEGSLYRTSRRYKMGGGPSDSNSQLIAPQAIPNFILNFGKKLCYGACMALCIGEGFDFDVCDDDCSERCGLAIFA